MPGIVAGSRADHALENGCSPAKKGDTWGMARPSMFTRDECYDQERFDLTPVHEGQHIQVKAVHAVVEKSGWLLKTGVYDTA